MAAFTSCPHFRAGLRSARPLPAGQLVRCPDCREHFLLPAPTAEEPVLAPAGPPLVLDRPRSLFGPEFVIAVAAAALVGVAIVVAAFVFARFRSSGGENGAPQAVAPPEARSG